MRNRRTLRNRQKKKFLGKFNIFRFLFLIFILLGVIFYFQNNLKVLLGLNELKKENKVLESLMDKKWGIEDFFEENLYLGRMIEQFYSSLSMSQRVAQVIMPSLDNVNSLEKISELIQNDKISGFMVLNKNIVQKDILKLKKLAKKYSSVPLFISMDAEPSLLKYRISDFQVFSDVKKIKDIPVTSSLKDKKDIAKFGGVIAENLKYLGVNINFAPVYDFGKNQAIISDRSFGGTAKEVSVRANLFAESQLAKNIFPTAKHFPGHGNVSGDTHKSLQTINGEFVELEAFASAIKNKIPLMMVGHLAVEKNKKYNTDGLPATLSKKIIKDLLREKLKFKGLIVTDAMNMGGVSSIKNRGLKSLKAGSDIILMPENVEKLHENIVNELILNKKFAQEFELKVKRVLRLKILWRLLEMGD